MNRLKEFRKKNNYSQKEVARLTGSSQSNYSKYEIGDVEPNIKTLIALANLYHTTIDELVGNKKRTDNISSDKQELIERINGLTQIECIKVGAYIDALIMQRKEKRKDTINSIINESEDTIV